ELLLDLFRHTKIDRCHRTSALLKISTMLLSASVPAKSMWPPPSPHARSVRLTLVHPPKLLWIPHRSEAKEIWGDTQQTGPESQAYRAGRTLQSDRKDLVC